MTASGSEQLDGCGESILSKIQSACEPVSQRCNAQERACLAAQRRVAQTRTERDGTLLMQSDKV